MSPPSPSGGVPKPIHISVKNEIAENPAAESVKPEHHPGFKLGLSIAMGLLAIAVAVGIFFAWRHFKPTPETTATVPAAPVGTQPNKPAVVAPATLPAGQTAPIPDTVPKLREAAAAQRIQEQARIDALATGSDVSEKTLPPVTSPLPAQPPAKIPPPASTVIEAPETPMPLAPGVTALSSGVIVSDASPAFRSFVANARITGVFQGDPPRAFINGRTVRAGEYVNASLGISFDSVDPEKKQIVFKDANGVTVTRKY